MSHCITPLPWLGMALEKAVEICTVVNREVFPELALQWLRSWALVTRQPDITGHQWAVVGRGELVGGWGYFLFRIFQNQLSD